MLRVSVLLLLLANGGYYAWSEGLLLPWGWGPSPESEPWRMQQQIRPEAVKVLPAEAIRPADAAAAAAAPAAVPASSASAAVPSATRASAAQPQDPATLPFRKNP